MKKLLKEALKIGITIGVTAPISFGIGWYFNNVNDNENSNSNNNANYVVLNIDGEDKVYTKEELEDEVVQPYSDSYGKTYDLIWRIRSLQIFREAM